MDPYFYFTLLDFHLAGTTCTDTLSKTVEDLTTALPLDKDFYKTRAKKWLASLVEIKPPTPVLIIIRFRDSTFYRFLVPFLERPDGIMGYGKTPGTYPKTFHSPDCNLLIGASLDFIRPFRNFVHEGSQPICLGTI